ncbi:uncharacterized protein LOC122645404 [Telopea speciosissima]|uniref:uncharacterized protein LOC122645404 n=1 Tax=Telopea speciosissima TaxID=54955 RepID=UPI001CC33B1D|nr:uncharacterized protein LOC122645404 [Telopea speciosissima]
MDMSSIPIYGSLKRFWSGRTYQRLDGTGGYIVRKKLRVLRLGGGNSCSTHTRRSSSSSSSSSKIRETRKLLQLRLKWPMKVLGKIREGYINMMLGLAGNIGYLEDPKNVFGEKRIPRGRPIPSVSKLNEFDKKLVLKVYNSIAASREFVAY